MREKLGWRPTHDEICTALGIDDQEAQRMQSLESNDQISLTHSDGRIGLQFIVERSGEWWKSDIWSIDLFSGKKGFKTEESLVATLYLASDPGTFKGAQVQWESGEKTTPSYSVANVQKIRTLTNLLFSHLLELFPALKEECKPFFEAATL